MEFCLKEMHRIRYGITALRTAKNPCTNLAGMQFTLQASRLNETGQYPLTRGQNS